MARVAFTVRRVMRASADDVWDALVDWAGHGRWIPATTVDVVAGNGGVSTRFVARSGVGPAALVDRMQVRERDDDARTATIDKVGPVLIGHTSVRVSERGTGSVVEWVEDVTIARLPQPAAGPIAAASRIFFERALHRLDRHLAD